MLTLDSNAREAALIFALLVFVGCSDGSINPRGMGTFCSDDGDCDRAVCGSAGVCTIACIDPDACDEISGWSCVQATRQCSCIGGAEIAGDSNDNDCDGVVDETGPGTDASRPDVGCAFEAFGFEDGDLPSGWSSTGRANWRVVDSASAPEGRFAAKSGNIGHSESSGLTTVFFTTAPSRLSFSYRTDSESCCDELHVYVNGSQVRELTSSSWSRDDVALDVGANTVEWRYEKDGSVSTGEDAAFIDDVEVRCGVEGE